MCACVYKQQMLLSMNFSTMRVISYSSVLNVLKLFAGH